MSTIQHCKLLLGTFVEISVSDDKCSQLALNDLAPSYLNLIKRKASK